jgi:4-alpha-glucanotransferase
MAIYHVQDAFSATGQGWGLPVYRWEVHERDDYRRCANARRRAELYDGCRIDHLVAGQRSRARTTGTKRSQASRESAE